MRRSERRCGPARAAANSPLRSIIRRRRPAISAALQAPRNSLHSCVILGPKNYYYLIDRHHLTRALHDEDVKYVPVAIGEDMSALDQDSFWAVLDNRGWMHPFDKSGHRREYSDIPTSVRDLIDDPFRSLASELKRRGEYAKSTAPFCEFRWADFLRSRILRATVEHDFDRAIGLAMKLT